MQKIQEIIELIDTLKNETTEQIHDIKKEIEKEPLGSNKNQGLWIKSNQLDAEHALLIKLKAQILESNEKQTTDPYEKRLIKWFGPDIDIKHKTIEIYRKNNHALFVVWHSNNLYLMKIRPSVNTKDNEKLIVSQQTCLPCYTYDEFYRGKKIATTVAEQICKL